MENNLNLNLKGGKLAKSRCGEASEFQFEFRRLKMNKIGKSRCWETQKNWKSIFAQLGEGRPKCFDLNLNDSK